MLTFANIADADQIHDTLTVLGEWLSRQSGR